MPGYRKRRRFLLMGAGLSTYISKVMGLGPVAYWPLNEAAGGTAEDISGNNLDGAYTAVTLGQTGIGDGNTAASFDGATSVCNIHSAGLDAAFPGVEGSLSAWIKVSGAGIWADALYHCMVRLMTNAGDQFMLMKTDGALIEWTCNMAGGATSTFVRTKLIAPTAWTHLGLTWSHAGNRARAYYNGVQEGADSGALAAFVGVLTAANTNIGAWTTAPNLIWSGTIAHVVLVGRELTATEMLGLATV